MDVGLYGLVDSVELAAFAQGCQAAGLRGRWRNHNLWTDDQVEKFDLVVLSGLRAQGKSIRDRYSERGVPVVVIDYGYLRRVNRMKDWQTGHWQVGLGRLNWVPDSYCPGDRFKALGLELSSEPLGNCIIVCGQHAGDPSHGLDESGIVAWADDVVRRIRAKSKKRVVWRAHPDSPHIVPSVKVDEVSTLSLKDDLSRAWAVVVICSNIGHDALLMGRLVFATGDPAYRSLAHSLDKMASARPASIEKRRRYFERLSYAQWTLEEMAKGQPIQFLLEHVARARV